MGLVPSRDTSYFHCSQTIEDCEQILVVNSLCGDQGLPLLLRKLHFSFLSECSYSYDRRSGHALNPAKQRNATWQGALAISISWENCEALARRQTAGFISLLVSRRSSLRPVPCIDVSYDVGERTENNADGSERTLPLDLPEPRAVRIEYMSLSFRPISTLDSIIFRISACIQHAVPQPAWSGPSSHV
jgi:hypothetical protein